MVRCVELKQAAEEQGDDEGSSEPKLKDDALYQTLARRLHIVPCLPRGMYVRTNESESQPQPPEPKAGSRRRCRQAKQNRNVCSTVSGFGSLRLHLIEFLQLLLQLLFVKASCRHMSHMTVDSRRLSQRRALSRIYLYLLCRLSWLSKLMQPQIPRLPQRCRRML